MSSGVSWVMRMRKEDESEEEEEECTGQLGMRKGKAGVEYCRFYTTGRWVSGINFKTRKSRA